MEVSVGTEEGFVREWTPCSHILNLIPPRIQTGIFSNELCLTCVDAVSEYIALGTNVGLVYWYDRKKGNVQRLRCEASNSPITYVKIVNTVDYMVGAGNALGQVTVFQIPKEHPENIPDNFKPKVEPKVERYTIGDLHKSKITAIEWSKNGMRLFSGDKNGVIIMTEIDFYMHLCKSMEIVNEGHSIVQISHCQSWLLISSVYRTIVCERRDGRWTVNQLGKKERKSLCGLGAVFQYSPSRGGAAVAYCARAGLRLWRAAPAGDVLHTLLFKEAISNPLTVAELLNPAGQRHTPSEQDHLGPIHVFREHFLVSHNDKFLYILDPRSLQAVACVDQLRRIVSVSVHKDEIFVVEGGRSLVRLAHSPEPAAHHPELSQPMTKSLTSSLQQAVNTVRDLTHIDATVPYITSVLEQPISIFTKNEVIDNTISSAEECFELPPIKPLPEDISTVEFVSEYRDATIDAEEIRRVKNELQKKLKMYNSIMERACDEKVLHSSRRSRRREIDSGGSTPRVATPVRKPDSVYTSPCVMDVSVYGNLNHENDEQLEREIAEKEKMLAKLLNLESLSITTKSHTHTDIHTDTYTDMRLHTDNTDPVTDTNTHTNTYKDPHKDTNKYSDYTYDSTHRNATTDANNHTNLPNEKQTDHNKPSKFKVPDPLDLMPRVMKLPNTWNLDGMELKLDIKNGYNDPLHSPDDNLDSEWEMV